MNGMDSALLVFIVGELVYLSYKVGRLEARVRNLENLIKHAMDERRGEK